jgi:hypothetical protein
MSDMTNAEEKGERMSIIFNQSGEGNTQIGSIGKTSLDKAVFDALVGAKTAASALKEFCQAEWYADLAKALVDMISKVIDVLESEK